MEGVVADLESFETFNRPIKTSDYLVIQSVRTWPARVKEAISEEEYVPSSEVTVTPCSGHCFSMVIFLLIGFM